MSGKKRAVCFLVVCFLVSSIIRTCVFAEESKVYRRIESAEKKIALTFDDGPHPRITREILSVLNEYGIKATFFVIGQNIENYPETMKLLAESGCEIGNHTFSHGNFRVMSEAEMAGEFEKCRNILFNEFLIEPTLIRPPEGVCSDALFSVSEQTECDIILWSIDTRDWAYTPASDIAKKVIQNVSGGDIILMHDYVSGRGQTADALRMIIPNLIERGFEFVTVGELINS